HIYYKYEGVSPAGSHKPNSAVAQAYANQQAGVRRLVTETGAGQWGSALALACRFFDLDCLIYMVGVSYDQKPYRRSMMETWGASRYDFGDTVGMTPLLPMYTLGHDFVPPPVHAGGLRYHGDSPILCGLVKAGVIEPRAYRQNETFAAAVRFARCEGILPGPEPAHAIRAVAEEAEAADAAGEERVILFNLSGHGHFDMSAYEAYLAGELEDPEFSEDDMNA